MQYVSVRDFRTSPGRIWDTLKRDGKVMVTNNGKPTAVMIDVDEKSADDTLAAIRQSEAMRLINMMRLDAMRSGNAEMSMNDIDNEISRIRAAQV